MPVHDTDVKWTTAIAVPCQVHDPAEASARRRAQSAKA
jgi:hypothetical protein